MSRVIVTETFLTIQGEGPATGKPSFFVRLGVCPLACAWCDTPFSSYNVVKSEQAFKGKEEEAVDWVIAQYSEVMTKLPQRLGSPAHVTHWVITGGEPLMPHNQGFLTGLANRVSKDFRPHTNQEFIFEIETCAVEPPDTLADTFDRISGVGLTFDVSPKLASSKQLTAANEKRRTEIPFLKWRYVSQAMYPCAFKFVVTRDHLEQDLQEIEALLESFDVGPSERPNQVYLMPEGIAFDHQWYQRVAEICFTQGYRFSPRVHVMLWGNERAR